MGGKRPEGGARGTKARKDLDKGWLSFFVAIALVVSVIIIWSFVAAQEDTTIFLVRHAEVDYTTNPSDPDLTQEGITRANELANLLNKVNIDAIFSTDYSRTKATAQPLATSKNLQIEIYDYNNFNPLINEVKQNHPGEKILIVGHAPTVPQIIDAFVGTSQGYQIDSNEFYKIFIVTIPHSGSPWSVQLKYGHVP